MRALGVLLFIASVGMLWAQAPVVPDPSKDVVWMCPMDKDIRSHGPGSCSRCGMKLVAGIPDPVEFHLDLKVAPSPPKPGDKAHLTFEVHDPWKNNLVKKFTTVHEKLFHAFIVSRDLEFFLHDHPVWEKDAFQYDAVLPKPGMYRILGDFYPEAATPQLISKTIFVTGAEPPRTPLERDYSTKDGVNLKVEFTTAPEQPVAGIEARLKFRLGPVDGFEKYLGAWGHLLAASEDLIDMMHAHPFLADGGDEVEFHLVFPRPRIYRVWVQFQRNGVVNTVHYDIPVKAEEVVPDPVPALR